jgi:O-antigen/teichoic acid export membrane protein
VSIKDNIFKKRMPKFIKIYLQHPRSKLAIQNILASIIIRGLNVILGLAFIPLLIDRLNPTNYGIWITLGSIINWFSFFDLGLGNGLKNHFAIAKAREDLTLAQIYVSTTYAFVSIIMIAIIFLFYFINKFLNWNNILNIGISVINEKELSSIALIVFCFFCLRFIFNLIGSILLADQRPAILNLVDFIGKLLSFLIIKLYLLDYNSTLLNVSLVLSATPVLILFISSIVLFNLRYKKVKPSFYRIKFDRIYELFNIGSKFFIIQLAVVLLYQTNIIIIGQLFGPEKVTIYNTAFTYFAILSVGFEIFISPIWSAITEAWTKNELVWIKATVNKLKLLWLFFLVIGFCLLFFSESLLRIWIGKAINVPLSVLFLMLIATLINSWNSIFSNFLNGVSKVKFQLFLGLIVAIINVPLAVFLGKLFGLQGVIFSNIIVTTIGFIMYPYQYKKLIQGSANGILNQ